MRRKNSLLNVILILVLVCIVAGTGFVFLSPQFEKNKPVIEFENRTFWNLKEPLNVKLSDESGIKYFKITYKDNKNEKVLKQEVLKTIKTDIPLQIKAPKLDMFFKGKEVSIVIQAVDNSKWNFFEGNQVVKEFKLKIDKKAPTANVIANSFAIRHGGSAVAVVEVKDENLEDAYISFNDEERFELIPFYKENYYIALIAWPVPIKEFKKVSVVAIDKAKNKTSTKIPLYIRKLKVRNSDIKINESFTKNVSARVLEKSGIEVPNNVEDIFIKANDELRAKNVKILKDVSRKFMNKDLVSNFDLKPFRRLSGSKTVAGFADKRSYYYNGNKIDEAWHLGMDWASIKRASIKTSNEGRVIFTDYLGIYGNVIIIDHKLGLQTLYAHTSKANVNVGDEVSRNGKIGNTGSTGAVFGDHLHFGVLIQGIEVNPLEWMDRNWIKTRITNVIKEAKKVINSK